MMKRHFPAIAPLWLARRWTGVAGESASALQLMQHLQQLQHLRHLVSSPVISCPLAEHFDHHRLTS